MNRRQLLAGLGTTGIGSALTVLPAGARQVGEKPTEVVPGAGVSPGPWGPQYVSTGEWIEYAWGWFQPYSDSTDADACDRVNTQLDRMEQRVELADRTISFGDTDAYWSDCEEWTTADGVEGQIAWWRYDTPPVPPGEYTIGFTWRALDEFEHWIADGWRTVPAGHEVEWSNTLVVERGRRKNRQ